MKPPEATLATLTNAAMYLGTDPVADAAVHGLMPIFPSVNELFLDLDNPEEDLPVLQAGLEILRDSGVEAGIWWEKPSKSGTGRHVIIRLDRAITPIERLALQATLGSDRKRELLGVMRVWLGLSERSSVLFEKQDTVAEIATKQSEENRHA